MKVLHVYKSMPPETFGGVERVIEHYCVSSSKFGVQNRIFTLTKQDAPTEEDMGYAKIYRAKRDLEIASTGFSLSAFNTFKKLANDSDLIHYHYPWPYMDLMHHYAVRNKKPYIISYHSDIVKQRTLGRMYRPLGNLFLKNAKLIIVSNDHYPQGSKVLGKHKEQIRVVPYFLDDAHYPTVDEKAVDAIKAKYGDFFLFVGVLRYYKGIQYLIEAARINKLPVVILGDGSERQKHIQTAKNLENVHFIAPVNDQEKVNLIEACKAVVLPSHLRSESFGMSLVEGAMLGKPLISCEINTGTSFVNIDGETGLSCVPANAQSLSEAMLRIYRSPTDAKKFGENARTRFEKELSSQKNSKLLRDLYSEALG